MNEDERGKVGKTIAVFLTVTILALGISVYVVTREKPSPVYAIIFYPGSIPPAAEKGEIPIWVLPEYVTYNVLIEEGKIPRGNVVFLEAEDATFKNFTEAVYQIAGKVNKNSVVWIALLGPGVGFDIGEIASAEEFDGVIDKISNGKVVITIDAKADLDPLKYGPCPRVIIYAETGYWGAIAMNMAMAFTGPDKKYTFLPYREPIYSLNADLDRNGYVSVWEAWKFVENYHINSGKELGYEPTVVQIWDPSNIARETYIVRIPVKFQDEENVGVQYHKEVIENYFRRFQLYGQPYVRICTDNVSSRGFP